MVNGLYPRHLGSVFLDIYEEEIVKPRIAAKKAGDKIMADGFKLSANSVYGKSNSEYSWLYDPLYTLRTTLAGQLALCMLSERIMTRIPESIIIQVNTDGVTSIISKDYEDKYLEICKEWENITKLSLEHVKYKKMVMRDVNSYLSVSVEGKVKYKGAFKTHSEMIKDGEYYKAFSQGIVPLALSKYYVDNIPVEDTITNHKNIWDFCKTFNASHGWECETFLIDEVGNEFDHKPQQKNNRYYISKNGRKFRKFLRERKAYIEANDSVIIFNKYIEKPFEEYEVDFEYYIEECYKIIELISGQKEQRLKEKKEEAERAKIARETENYLAFCINKIPTERQYELYKKDYLIEQYGEPKSIKPSRGKVSPDQVTFDFMDEIINREE